jgi:hypothetical protein
MKNSRWYHLIFLFSTSVLFAQEYERTWGTYFGPAGTYLGQTYVNNNLQIDPLDNLHLFGSVLTNSSYTASYYSQFATAGQAYDLTKPSNLYIASVGSTGNLISSQYSLDTTFNLINSSYDSGGNRYGLELSVNGLTGSGTAGTWFPTSTSYTNKILLSKFNASGTLLWKTFLPTESYTVKVIHDQLGNSYIYGNTKMQSGLGTTGVFQENYEVVLSGGNAVLPNSYIAKLSATGSLEWATYFPAKTIYKLNFHDNNLYILADNDTNINSSQLATTGAFQTEKAACSITKLNALNGTRIWGTYYGPTGSVLQLPSGMITNSSGIYLIGDFQDFTGNSGSYFATAGSFQPAVAGLTDIYLSKFSHSGSRLWSTYFGSAGDEISGYNDNPIAFIGSDVILTLAQFSNGNTNLATPGAYISSQPTLPGTSSHYNLVFAKFNENGFRQWSSYYGGASINNSYNPSISVVVKDLNSFYLYGATLASTGISTEGAIQPTSLPNMRTGFLARFNLKNLSTNETDQLNDLTLHDNPNNGNFTISGDILKKKDFELRIYDVSGRLFSKEKMNRDQKQVFNYQGKVHTGNYIVQISDETNFKKTFKMIVQ